MTAMKNWINENAIYIILVLTGLVICAAPVGLMIAVLRTGS